MDTERIPSTPPPSREQLLRYLRGELPPPEQHAVERALEADPLLRDAVDGLQEPGALQALASLTPPGGASPVHWPYRLLGGALVVGVITVVVYMLRMPQPSPEEVRTLLSSEQGPAPEAVLAPNTDSVLRVVHEEIAAVQAVPAPEAAELPARAPERFDLPDSLLPAAAVPAGRDTAMRPTPSASRPTPIVVVVVEQGKGGPVGPPAERPSRQLLYIHDLKLVHPRELYGTRTPSLIPVGVPADRENANTRIEPQVTVSYIDFMDRALGAFARHRYSAALDDLYFLLGQYPDDVNAQFYAGLCCYELGLFPRARKLLDRAGRNSVDTFNEEAAWYGALALEQEKGRPAALEAFARIAGEGGFYAERARERSVR